MIDVEKLPLRGKGRSINDVAVRRDVNVQGTSNRVVLECLRASTEVGVRQEREPQ